MIIVKNSGELKLMAAACRLSAEALAVAGKHIKAGMSTYELNKIIQNFIVGNGAKPSFLGYNGFKGSACISVNEELIHGIPSKRKIIRDGDIVSVDVGAYIGGFHGDNAYTFQVGNISEAAGRLLAVTEQ